MAKAFFTEMLRSNAKQKMRKYENDTSSRPLSPLPRYRPVDCRRTQRTSRFGIPGKRAFPMPDAEHVRDAESRFHLASDEDKPELARRILAKAQEFGVNVQSPNVLEWANK